MTNKNYVIFIENITDKHKRKTEVYWVQSIYGAMLGSIKWYSHWRQYAFFPRKDTVYSAGCMREIEYKIRHLMFERG